MYNIEQPHRPFRNSDEEPIGVDPAEVEIPPILPDTPIVSKDWAECLDYIECADSIVGEALAALDETGCSNDTLVIFLGDHGPAFQPRKRTLYDFGLRVPIAIKRTGIRTGAVSDDLVSETDITPTILDYLGPERPDLEHGLSEAVVCGRSEGSARRPHQSDLPASFGLGGRHISRRHQRAPPYADGWIHESVEAWG